MPPSKFYSFDQIKERADCIEVAKMLGLQLDRNNRCAATWRGGKNPTSVAINRDGFCDHGNGGESGSAIDLAALIMFGGNIHVAQEYLGGILGLDPVITLSNNPKSQYEELKSDGYVETKKYIYTDAEGNPVHYTYRLEHPDPARKKRFVQQAADGKWTLKHITPQLYNLPAIISAPLVILVEGEKDADTLIALNLPATCNPMGAGKWLKHYTDILRGKDIVILRDNDDAGELHARLLCGELNRAAKSIRVPEPLSDQSGGDVTDWIKSGDGTVEKLWEIINQTPRIDPSRVEVDFELARAKSANKYPLRNFRTEKTEQKSGVVKTTKRPISLVDLIRDTHTRFLGFPRKVGEKLFDHDRDTGRIYYMRTHKELMAWIARKSKHNADWTRGDAFIAKDEYFEGLKAEAARYESISYVPDYPRRADVYYAHESLPEPDPDHKYLNKFANFFEPAKPEFRALIKTLIASPIYYERFTPRPMWIIDSECPGAGKSSLASRLAILYGHPAVEVKPRDLARDTQEITKRLVSTEGRNARVLLIDNVTGTFSSQELAGMVTIPDITGRAPYGHGEESRPNNLTYIITANNASIDNDLSIRSYFIELKKIDRYNANWNRDLNKFIEKHRLNIMADIIDILKNHTPFECEPATRFPEFETMILQAMCEDEDEYHRALEVINQARDDANIEDEWGQAITEMFRSKLSDLNIHPDKHNVWIRSQVADDWTREALPDVRVRYGTQFIRNLVRTGHLTRLDAKFKEWPHHPLPGVDRRKGILWLHDENSVAKSIIYIVVGKKGKNISVIDVPTGLIGEKYPSKAEREKAELDKIYE